VKLAKWFLRGKVARQVAQDSRIPGKFKWLLAFAILYGISPIDLVPDIIPILGLADDLVIVSMLLLGAIRSLSQKVGSPQASAVRARRLGIDPDRVLES
jgi:uncharacterized membrane protein YkvA (DUF1232 family)